MVMAGSMPVFADAPVPQDFAFGFEVEIEAQGALYELELPDDVYRSQQFGTGGTAYAASTRR